jgi:hypothetical protein
MINPDEAVKSIQGDKEYLKALQVGAIHMALIKARWQYANTPPEAFEEWLLNVDALTLINEEAA